MQTEITVKELSRINEPLIIDIRTSDAYERGTLPGAVNISVSKEAGKDLPDISPVLDYLRKERHPEDKPVYLLCHTGAISQDAAELLQEAGYAGVNIKGGYRTYLVAKLRQEAESGTEGRSFLSQSGTGRNVPLSHFLTWSYTVTMLLSGAAVRRLTTRLTIRPTRNAGSSS